MRRTLKITGLAGSGRTNEIPLVLDLVKTRVLRLPDPNEESACVRRYNISTGSDQIERLIVETIVEASWIILGESGESVAQEAYRGDWDELVTLASSS